MAALVTVRTTPARLAAAVQSRQTDGNDTGMTTAEYAVGTVAACGFAGVLYKVITSPIVIDLLKAVISKAFQLSF
ncbi:MAG: rane protein [Frankiales bacterium]|nr:rane protein [Frankiales bacterium]